MNMTRKFSRRGFKTTQHGMTLVVGLIMLLVITLFVVSAIRLSTANLRTVGNMQARNEAAAASQRAIEDMMSSTAAFTTPASIVPGTPVTVTVNKTDYSVARATPVCVKAVPVTGNSYNNSGLAMQDTYWDLQTTATNAKSGASVTTHQGVKVRLDASAICP
jgi:Tfp pilus assembly protein PilX